MPLELIPEIKMRPDSSRPDRPWKGFFRAIETRSHASVYWEDCTEEEHEGALTEEEARRLVEERISEIKGTDRGLASLIRGIGLSALKRKPPEAVTLMVEVIGDTWHDHRVFHELLTLMEDGWELLDNRAEIRAVLDRMKSTFLLQPR